MRRDGGRQFQTSGTQTVNARRPSSVRARRVTAAQVDSERRDHRFEYDAVNHAHNRPHRSRDGDDYAMTTNTTIIASKTRQTQCRMFTTNSVKLCKTGASLELRKGWPGVSRVL